MKYSFTTKKLALNLILGCIWTFLGISKLLTAPELKLLDSLFLFLGIFYLSYFLYEYVKKYFEVTSEKITVFSIPAKEVNLSELVEAKYYADDYTFKTAGKTLKIIKSQIKKSQRDEFDHFFNRLKDKLDQQHAASM